jgi:hypothetical protein
MATCPLCRQPADSWTPHGPSGGIRAATGYECEYCGRFIYSSIMSATKLEDWERWRLSAAVRSATDRGELTEIMSSDYLALIDANPEPSVPEQLDLTLRLIAMRGGPGKAPAFLTARFYPYVGASGPEGMAMILSAIEKEGLATQGTERRENGELGPHFKLEMRGYERLRAASRAARGATGWKRVDDSLKSAETAINTAETELDFQGVGHKCRETIVSLAQAVFDAEKHPILDGAQVSPTDAKRMLEAYVAVQLADHDKARSLVRSAETFTSNVTHKRSADFRSAALCLEATRSLVEMVAILEGRRDP